MGFFDFPERGLRSFFSPEEGYEAASRRAQQGWQEAKGYQEPFYKHGLDEYGRLNSAIQSLLNPEQLQSQWSMGYETSPMAKRLLDLSREQGLESASSMGLMGSSGALRNLQLGAGDIVAKDRQQYLQDLMNKYLAGLGLSQGIYNTGASTGSELGRQAIGIGETLGGLDYGKARAPGQLLENLLKAGITGYSMGAGGGAGAALKA